MSNTLFFELGRNWSGVLIEGNPRNHRALLSKNRNAYVVRACLSPSTSPQTVKYKAAGLAGGIASYMTVSHMNTFNIWNQSTVEVQCFPLNSIAAALGIRHIDYMSLDVEGSELEILRTLDLSQLSVDVISVEYAWKRDKLQQLRSLFNSAGKYTEVGYLPVGTDENTGQDVVFMRTEN